MKKLMFWSNSPNAFGLDWGRKVLDFGRIPNRVRAGKLTLNYQRYEDTGTRLKINILGRDFVEELIHQPSGRDDVFEKRGRNKDRIATCPKPLE